MLCSPFLSVKRSATVAVLVVLLTMGMSSSPSVAHAQPKPDPKTEDEAELLPGSLPIAALPIELAEAPGLPRRSVTVLYAPATTKYFLFPTFTIAEVNLVSPDGGNPSPLFRKQDKEDRADTKGVTDGRVEVTVIDLLRSKQWTDRLTTQLSAAPALTGKTLAYPDVTEALDVALVFTDRNKGGQRRVIGTSRLTRALGQDRHDLGFRVSPDDLNAIHGTRPSDLGIETMGAYKCEFVETQFRATLDYTSGQATKLVNRLKTAPGKQTPTLLVAAGGSGGQESSIADVLSEASAIVIETPIARTKEIDPALVKSVFDSLLTRLNTAVKLQDQAKGTVVSFLLSNQLRFTSALGQVEEASHEAEKLNEAKFKSLYEQLSKEAESGEAGGGLNVLDIVSIGGHGSSQSMSEGQLKQLHEQFNKDLSRVREMVKGDIPTVTAMNIGQVQSALLWKNIEDKVEFRDFRRGTKTLVMRLSFQTLDGAPPLADYLAKLKQLQEGLEGLKAKTDAMEKAADAMEKAGWKYTSFHETVGTRGIAMATLNVPAPPAQEKITKTYPQPGKVVACWCEYSSSPGEASKFFTILATPNGNQVDLALEAVPGAAACRVGVTVHVVYQK
jgi:hypothetical protein